MAEAHGTRGWCVPLLMYHHVRATVDGRAQTYLSVSSETFARQMRLLARMGYRGVTFAEAALALSEGRRAGSRLVCITFDDGYVSVAENAAPVLHKLAWPATVFVPTRWVGQRNEWDASTGKPVQPIMAWDALAELAARGWEVAAHSRTHPHLETLSADDAWEEIAGCRRDLESQLGASPQTFCYPYGTYSPAVVEMVRKAGYTAACTTQSGLARSGMDAMLYPRVKVAHRDGILGLLYRLWIRPHLR